MAVEFVQGNTYELPVKLSYKEGVIDGQMVSEAEFTFGAIRKMYPDEVTYDAERQAFIVPLSQCETFLLQGNVKYQARVKFTDGAVKGTRIGCSKVYDSISKAVL